MMRRWLRRATVVVAALVVLALVGALVFSLYGSRRLARARERLAAEVGLAELARFQRPELSEPENAAAWLLAGAGAVVLSHEEREFLRSRSWTTPDGLDARWSEEDAARLKRLVESNAPAFELLERSLACPASSYGIDYTRGPEAELPPILELLRAGRLVWIDGRLALADGDTSRAERDLRILDRLAGSLADESTITTFLVAVAVDRYSLDLVHRLITAGVAERELLEKTDSILAAHAREESFRRALAAESSMAVAASPELLLGAGENGPLWGLGALLARPSHRLMLAGMLEDYAEIAALGGEPFAAVRLPGDEDRPGLLRPTRVAMMYPNLVDAVGKLKTGETLRLLAREAVALRLTLLEQGTYPQRRGPAGAEPYSGRQMTLEEGPDGSLVIAARGALELWRERNPRGSFPGEPPFVWMLPDEAAEARCR